MQTKVEPGSEEQLIEALVSLRDAYVAAVGMEVARLEPAMGCCGCDSEIGDVVTAPAPPEAPHGENYCWDCVDGSDWPTGAEYTVLPGRARTATE